MRPCAGCLQFSRVWRSSTSFSSVPWNAASRFHAMQRRREDYLTLLRDGLPAFQESFTAAGASSMNNAAEQASGLAGGLRKETGVLRSSPRAVLRNTMVGPPRSAGGSAVPSAAPPIPLDWLTETTQALERMLAGIVDPHQIRANDYFLSACLHPSYLSQQMMALPPGRQRRAARAAVEQAAMPPELLRTGAAALRVLAELSWLHDQYLPRWGNRRDGNDEESSSSSSAHRNQPLGSAPLVSPPLTGDRMLTTAIQCGLPPLVLFSEAYLMAASSTATAVPKLTWLTVEVKREAEDEKGTEGMTGMNDRGPTSTTDRSAERSVPPLVRRIPSNVLGDAFTALCGAIDLVEGTEAVAMFLDRWIPAKAREGGASSDE